MQISCHKIISKNWLTWAQTDLSTKNSKKKSINIFTTTGSKPVNPVSWSLTPKSLKSNFSSTFGFLISQKLSKLQFKYIKIYRLLKPLTRAKHYFHKSHQSFQACKTWRKFHRLSTNTLRLSHWLKEDLRFPLSSRKKSSGNTIRPFWTTQCNYWLCNKTSTM